LVLNVPVAGGLGWPRGRRPFELGTSRPTGGRDYLTRAGTLLPRRATASHGDPRRRQNVQPQHNPDEARPFNRVGRPTCSSMSTVLAKRARMAGRPSVDRGRQGSQCASHRSEYVKVVLWLHTLRRRVRTGNCSPLRHLSPSQPGPFMAAWPLWLAAISGAENFEGFQSVEWDEAVTHRLRTQPRNGPWPECRRFDACHSRSRTGDQHQRQTDLRPTG
jgi:hypothetical protein